MRLAGWASSIHKWLALIVGVQMLCWIASGLFFAIYPIERVRSEHRLADAPPAALPIADVPNTSDIVALLPAAPLKLSFERDARGRFVAVAELPEGRAALIDLSERRVISPLSQQDASIIAAAAIANAPPVREARLVSEESPEYRGALPAWRIAFDDAEGLAVYVAAETGRVTARRSDLWRVYDALWALHIMDWRDHENFNTGLLIAASALALIVSLAGFVLFPYRLSFGRRPKR